MEGQPRGSTIKAALASGKSFKSFVPQGAEAWGTFHGRVVETFNRIIFSHLESVSPHIVLVTHGGFIHTLLEYFQSVAKCNVTPLVPRNVSISQFHISPVNLGTSKDGDGFPFNISCLQLNCTTHLEEIINEQTEKNNYSSLDGI